MTSMSCGRLAYTNYSRLLIIGERIIQHTVQLLSEEHKETIRLANSMPKPWISESAKQQHKNGTAYKFNVKDCAKGGKKTASRKWYNNGRENKYITDGDYIPEGFVRGRITGWNTHP